MLWNRNSKCKREPKVEKPQCDDQLSAGPPSVSQATASTVSSKNSTIPVDCVHYRRCNVTEHEARTSAACAKEAAPKCEARIDATREEKLSHWGECKEMQKTKKKGERQTTPPAEERQTKINGKQKSGAPLKGISLEEYQKLLITAGPKKDGRQKNTLVDKQGPHQLEDNQESPIKSHRSLASNAKSGRAKKEPSFLNCLVNY
jgi:hypothetical protein